MKSIGIDIGGTKIEIALVENGLIIDSKQEPTNKERLLDQIVRLIETYNMYVPIGIGCAGQITDGIIKNSPNLGLKNTPLKEELEKAIQWPVTLINDVQAAAYGEAKMGAGKNKNRFFISFLGTGIGGAIYNEGQVWEGTAGEIGHVVVHQGGNLCTCGNRGCLEAYAGGWALAKESSTGNAHDAFNDLQIAGAGFQALVTAFTSLNNLLNPELILLGGNLLKGYQKAFPEFLKELEFAVRSQSLPTAGYPLKIELATLEKPVLVGSALKAISFD